MVKIRCSILKISCYKVHISIYLHSCPTCKQLADFERDSVPRPGSPAFQGEGGRGGGGGACCPRAKEFPLDAFMPVLKTPILSITCQMYNQWPIYLQSVQLGERLL